MLAHRVSVATPSLNFALHSAMDASRGVGGLSFVACVGVVVSLSVVIFG